MAIELRDVARRLAAGGFVAADEEAAMLVAAATEDADLDGLLDRRLAGEPLAWVVGHTTFAGRRVLVHRGVYVPRPRTEVLVARAVTHLPAEGVAVDVCTGSGAIAAALLAARPAARVLAVDNDERAVRCARANGVDAVVGDLLTPVPADVRGHVDVVVGCPPYVPTAALPLLQRDTFTFESRLAYDGGADGLEFVRAVLEAAREVLRPGGVAVLEVGGDQPAALAPDLAAWGYAPARALDDDGLPCGIAVRWPGSRG